MERRTKVDEALKQAEAEFEAHKNDPEARKEALFRRTQARAAVGVNVERKRQDLRNAIEKRRKWALVKNRKRLAHLSPPYAHPYRARRTCQMPKWAGRFSWFTAASIRISHRVKPCLCSTTQINTPTAQETLTRRVSWVPHEGVEKGKERKYEAVLDGTCSVSIYFSTCPSSESHNPEERPKPNRASSYGAESSDGDRSRRTRDVSRGREPNVQSRVACKQRGQHIPIWDVPP